MNHRTFSRCLTMLLPAPLLALALYGCGSSGGDTGGTGGGGGGGGGNGGGNVVCQGTKVMANEANDYTFSSTLTFPPIKVKPSAKGAPPVNLLFDWSGVTADFIRHAIDPKKDLDTILIFAWGLDLNTLQDKINADTVASRDMTIVPPLQFPVDDKATSAHLLDFLFNGTPIGGELAKPEQVALFFDDTEYDPKNNTLTMMAATGTVLGQGTKMIQSFILDPSSTNTTVTMTKDSTKLDFHADLTKLKPTGINQGGVTFDWSQMTTNALGADFSGDNASRITAAFIGHYSESASELSGDKFLDIELIATQLFRKNIDTGTSVDLSSFKDSNDKPFSGVDNNGTWLLGLQCGDCRNPAPWYLTVLKPCS
jgi:hypothetical protein